MNQNVLIAGCGYVGHALAEKLRLAGAAVTALTHSEESAAALRKSCDFSIEACDIGSPESVRSLRSTPDLIVHCASSGRRGADAYEKVYLGGCENLISAFPDSPLLFTSSTSVYPQTSGELVTETSDAEPDRDTGKILRRAENAVLAASGIVARLAGLYGPGRSVILQRFLDGSAIIETGPSRALNQIHRDDVVSAILTLLQALPASAGQIYNVADGAPTTQRATFEALATHFGQPAPPEGPPDPNRKRGWTHKLISNAKLRQLGWAPAFPTFLDAVRDDPALLPSIQQLLAREP